MPTVVVGAWEELAEFAGSRLEDCGALDGAELDDTELDGAALEATELDGAVLDTELDSAALEEIALDVVAAALDADDVAGAGLPLVVLQPASSTAAPVSAARVVRFIRCSFSFGARRT